MTPDRWIANNLKALDILANTSVGCSATVETFSRRAGRARRAGKPWGCCVCAVLNPIVRFLTGQVDHCEAARTAGEIE